MPWEETEEFGRFRLRSVGLGVRGRGGGSVLGRGWTSASNLFKERGPSRVEVLFDGGARAVAGEE